MAVDIKPQHIAIAGGAAIVGALLLSRSGGGGTTFIQTGPSEATARELIRAGVESQAIEAGRQVDLADIFTGGEVEFSRIASGERIAFEETRAFERVAIHKATSEENIAKSFAASLDLRTKTQAEVERAKVAAEEQRSTFDFFGDILKAVFPFIF